MAKETCIQPRLDPDVSALVRASADKNCRSVAGEVNFILREHYEVQALGKKLMADEARCGKKKK